MNRALELQGLAKKDIEAALDQPNPFVVNFEPKLLHSANRGVPLLEANPDSPLSKLIVDIAYYLSKDEHTKRRLDQPTRAWLGAESRRQRREAV